MKGLSVLLQGLLTVFLSMWFLKSSWNHTLPVLFKLPEIGWGQSFWLLLLANCLFNQQSIKMPAPEKPSQLRTGLEGKMGNSAL